MTVLEAGHLKSRYQQGEVLVRAFLPADGWLPSQWVLTCLSSMGVLGQWREISPRPLTTVSALKSLQWKVPQIRDVDLPKLMSSRYTFEEGPETKTHATSIHLLNIL